MAKMNLEFLLSPESNASRADLSSDGHSTRADSPFSLEYIAPRSNASDHHRYRSQHHQRRSTNHSMGAPPGAPPKIPQKDVHQNSVPAKPNFKSKKSKSPTPSAQRSSSSAEVKPHVCPQCDRSFYKLEQLKRHDRLVHQNLRPFVCNTCDLSFGTKQNMQVHRTTRKHRHRLQTLESSGRSSHATSSRQHH